VANLQCQNRHECRFWHAQGIEAEIPQTPGRLPIPYLPPSERPAHIGTARPGKRPEKYLEFSAVAYRRYDVSKIAEADSTSIFPGFSPVMRYAYGMGQVWPGVEELKRKARSPECRRHGGDAPRKGEQEFLCVYPRIDKGSGLGKMKP
jgi:hypothetical protein